MHFPHAIRTFVGTGLLLAASHLAAQSSDKRAVTPANPCTDADFLIGDWETFRQDVKSSTVNMKPGPGHCSIIETWTGENDSGNWFALMTYDNATHTWDYLAASSKLARQSLAQGVFDGQEFKFVPNTSDGKLHRFSYFKLPDGKLREYSATSTDGGKTWKTGADLIWTKKQ